MFVNLKLIAIDNLYSFSYFKCVVALLSGGLLAIYLNPNFFFCVTSIWQPNTI